MGKSVAIALVSAVLVAACGPGVGPVTGPAAAPGGASFATRNYVPPIYAPSWGAFGLPYGAPGFPYAWGFPNYVQPIYTPNIGNPFVPPPVAAGPWINPIYGTVNFSVGFPWAAGFNGVPAF